MTAALASSWASTFKALAKSRRRCDWTSSSSTEIVMPPPPQRKGADRRQGTLLSGGAHAFPRPIRTRCPPRGIDRSVSATTDRCPPPFTSSYWIGAESAIKIGGTQAHPRGAFPFRAPDCQCFLGFLAIGGLRSSLGTYRLGLPTPVRSAIVAEVPTLRCHPLIPAVGYHLGTHLEHTL